MFRKFFSGRLNRRTYFLSILILNVVSLSIIDRISNSSFWIHAWMYLFFFLNTSISFRRLQDIGLRRLFIVIIIVVQIYRSLIIAFLGSLFVTIYPWWIMYLISLILIIYPGQNKPNRYGPVPTPKVEWKKFFGEFKTKVERH